MHRELADIVERLSPVVDRASSLAARESSVAGSALIVVETHRRLADLLPQVQQAAPDVTIDQPHIQAVHAKIEEIEVRLNAPGAGDPKVLVSSLGELNRLMETLESSVGDAMIPTGGGSKHWPHWP